MSEMKAKGNKVQYPRSRAISQSIEYTFCQFQGENRNQQQISATKNILSPKLILEDTGPETSYNSSKLTHQSRNFQDYVINQFENKILTLENQNKRLKVENQILKGKVKMLEHEKIIFLQYETQIQLLEKKCQHYRKDIELYQKLLTTEKRKSQEISEIQDFSIENLETHLNSQNSLDAFLMEKTFSHKSSKNGKIDRCKLTQTQWENSQTIEGQDKYFKNESALRQSHVRSSKCSLVNLGSIILQEDY